MIRKLVQREVRREFRSGGYTDLVLAGLDARVSGSDASALGSGQCRDREPVSGARYLGCRPRHRHGRPDGSRVGTESAAT